MLPKGGVKKKKAKKDPNAPKRPLSAYFLYVSESAEPVWRHDTHECRHSHSAHTALTRHLVLPQTAERRDALKKEQPDIAFGEMGKVMGSEWRAMSEAKKAPYEKKAEAAKASEFCAETHR